MIIENELHYTSKHTFAKLKEALDRGDKEKVIQMFEQRVKELYLEPARLLIEHAKHCKNNNCKNNIGFLFSAGLICVSTIDFLGRFYTGCPKGDVGSRFIGWLLSYMQPPFDGYLANKFYKDFRNGLVHECRIKNGGEFSLSIDNLFVLKRVDNREYLVVNPEVLLEEIRKGFDKYLKDLRKNNILFEELINCLKKDFKSDFSKNGRDDNDEG